MLNCVIRKPESDKKVAVLIWNSGTSQSRVKRSKI